MGFADQFAIGAAVWTGLAGVAGYILVANYLVGPLGRLIAWLFP